MKYIRYGSENTTTAIDEEGSTIETERKFNNYQVAATRKHFKVRVRVNNEQEQADEFAKFVSTLTSEKLDTSFSILHTEAGDQAGWWYVVKAWTEIVR